VVFNLVIKWMSLYDSSIHQEDIQFSPSLLWLMIEGLNRFIPQSCRKLFFRRLFFLRLLANNNKILTRDNLAKRRKVDDNYGLFCKESEILDHLF
jgi:hypothetical protein